MRSEMYESVINGVCGLGKYVHSSGDIKSFDAKTTRIKNRRYDIVVISQNGDSMVTQ